MNGRSPLDVPSPRSHAADAPAMRPAGMAVGDASTPGRDVRRPARRSVRSRQEEQRGLHALADVVLRAEVELEEDRVDVLLDRSLGQEEGLRDGAVALAL